MKKMGVLTLVLLVLTLCRCTSMDINHTGGAPAEIYRQFIQAVEAHQIIGEGTDFLTDQIDLAQPLPAGYQIYAQAVDENGVPLREVSSFAFCPGFGNKLWYYFLLYAPRGTHPAPLQSRYIKFMLTGDGKIVSEKYILDVKDWGRPGEVKIFDLPAPPDEIHGYLVLKDYTFLAGGDFRTPEGYYVEGKVIGSRGRWFRFFPTSEILGSEAEDMQMSFPMDRGWLELSMGKTHSMQDALSPIAPYVEGWWDGKGYFHPQPPIFNGPKQPYD